MGILDSEVNRMDLVPNGLQRLGLPLGNSVHVVPAGLYRWFHSVRIEPWQLAIPTTLNVRAGSPLSDSNGSKANDLAAPETIR